jgi:hypothetical protein
MLDKYVKDVKEIGKIFPQLKLLRADILPIQSIRPNFLLCFCIRQIKITRSGEPFIFNIKIIRKRLAAIRRNKSMGRTASLGQF